MGLQAVAEAKGTEMHKRGGLRRKPAFTIIELLTVVAIIALLISILIPSVNKARDAAKRASSQNLLSVLGKGCELFHTDLDRYPVSSGGNPFEADPNLVPLSGAQWLMLQLAGADLKGFVALDKNRYYDVNNDGVINYLDWLAWYDPNSDPDPNSQNTRRRFGPYVPLDGKAAQTPTYFKEQTSVTRLLSPGLLLGSSAYSNNKLAFAVDAFGGPVLYYVANDQAKSPFSFGHPAVPIGRYDQYDNWQLTGSETTGDTGINLTGRTVSDSPARYHWLFNIYLLIGGVPNDPAVRPDANTFAASVHDEALYDQTGNKVWPHRPDTYLLIAPGRDGIYGTADDVKNY
jgi:prepilin-type N-terminal cleavage/methylation domain-containing protein